MKVINCIGKVCPLPVIETRNQLKEVKELETLVDNEIAVQNLKKLALQLGAKVESNKDEDGFYHVYFQTENIDSNDVEPQIDQKKEEYYNVIVGSNKMGNGDSKLGESLMQTFLFTLSQQDQLPKNLIFYNSGVKLVTRNSSVLPELENLEKAGVKVAACGVCLNYYGLTDEVVIGEITNMYRIVEAMHEYDRTIRL